MKVLIFTLEFPPQIGGAGVYCLELATGLKKLGHEVTLLTTSYGSDNEEFDVNFNLIRLQTRKKTWFLQWTKRITEHLKSNEYDKIIIGNYHAALSFIKMKELPKTPFLFTLHGDDVDYLYDRTKLREKLLLNDKKVNRFLNQVENVICVSDYLGNQLVEKGFDKDKIKVIHHGIDLEFFKNIKSEPTYLTERANRWSSKNVDANKKILLCASRIVEGKGHDILLKGFKKALSLNPNLILAIAGNGDSKEEIEILSNQLGLSNNVKFLGGLTRFELRDYYQVADAFILMSRRRGETFGLVFIEAMACGTPVVAAQNGAVAEIIEENINGLLVPPLDEQLCGESMNRIFDLDETQKFGEKGFETVKSKFNNLTMAAKTIE